MSKLRKVTGQFMVAPGRGLSQWWFPYPGEWHHKRVHARLRAAAEEWPRGYRPQAFLSRVSEVVEAHAVGEEGRESRVVVVNRIGLPMVGRNAVPGPYLFIGVVGLGGPSRGYECLQGWAQPIVSPGCPVPVDSDYERRAFGTLLKTGEMVQREFPGVEMVIEKPVFDIETPEGPCLPDFIVKVVRGSEELRFIIEVMGFDRASYLEGKEGTHPRMETLGTLCTMDATAFDRSSYGVTAQGQRVTQRMRDVLRSRWRGRSMTG